MFRLLHETSDFVAIEKPAGFYVHPPEDQSFRISRGQNAMAILRDQLGRYVYPVHRLDRATSGVVLYALTKEKASELGGLFTARQVEKTYVALVRGFSKDSWIDSSPMAEDEGPLKDAETEFETIYRFTLPIPDREFPVSRYSLVLARPKTGRFHQIRRHLKRAGHPIIGDTVRGDGAHNRKLRELTGDHVLYLKALKLDFQGHSITSRWGKAWQKLFDHAGFCPRV